MAQDTITSYQLPPLPPQLARRWTEEDGMRRYNEGAHEANQYYTNEHRTRPIPAKPISRKNVTSKTPDLVYEREQQPSYTTQSLHQRLPSFEDLDHRFAASLTLSGNGFDPAWQNESAEPYAVSGWKTSEQNVRQTRSAHPGLFREAKLEALQNAPDVSQTQGLQYHAFDNDYKQHSRRVTQVTDHSRQSSGSGGERSVALHLDVPPTTTCDSRPNSAYSDPRGRRTASPYSAQGSDQGSLTPYDRPRSASRHSPAVRASYVGELNNVPYNQQIAPGGLELHKSLQNIVGSGASLLDTKKTIDMYRANIKKDTEPAVQYEFAILMVNAARDATPDSGFDPAELITEAKNILQRLADRAYPFAQYFLGDGYFSGFFNKEKPDHEKAFSLFIAASKHGHAEAGYRAGLCYEFGWGTNKSYPKAYQFYRASASKNHPGAATRLGLACLHGDMGLSAREKYREGLKWLKRAQESADVQYNAAPYELGLLHLQGFGDGIFKDEPYAAQLFTQSAELGHTEANFLMGQAYETGLFECPKDAALSVHFYNGAASKRHPDAMMAICAWYMVGAEPVLEKDEGEAYAWALQAAETGFAKAEYAVGYFTEMGIGCRRDPLGANVWYVRAAEQGDLKAKQRLQVIRAAAEGASGGDGQGGKKEKKKFMGLC